MAASARTAALASADGTSQMDLTHFDHALSTAPRRRPDRRGWLAGSSAIAGSLALTLATSAYALPTGGQVAAGAATIEGAPGGLTITQSSQNAAINWQGFSIGQGEAVTFVQPNAQSVTLKSTAAVRNILR